MTGLTLKKSLSIPLGETNSVWGGHASQMKKKRNFKQDRVLTLKRSCQCHNISQNNIYCLSSIT